MRCEMGQHYGGLLTSSFRTCSLTSSTIGDMQHQEVPRWVQDWLPGTTLARLSAILHRSGTQAYVHAGIPDSVQPRV